jgi:hypothetical protein
MYTLRLKEKFPILFFRQDLTKANHTLVPHVELPEFYQDFIFSLEILAKDLNHHVDRKFHFQQLLLEGVSQRAQ